MSRFASTYMTQTSGLNQCTHAAAIRSSLETASNRRMCTNSCSKTYCSAVSSFQSVFLGIRMTGCRTPKVRGDEIWSDCRMQIPRRSGCVCSHCRDASLSTGKDMRNSRQHFQYTAAKKAAQRTTPAIHTMLHTEIVCTGAASICGRAATACPGKRAGVAAAGTSTTFKAVFCPSSE